MRTAQCHIHNPIRIMVLTRPWTVLAFTIYILLPWTFSTSRCYATSCCQYLGNVQMISCNPSYDYDYNCQNKHYGVSHLVYYFIDLHLHWKLYFDGFRCKLISCPVLNRTKWYFPQHQINMWPLPSILPNELPKKDSTTIAASPRQIFGYRLLVFELYSLQFLKYWGDICSYRICIKLSAFRLIITTHEAMEHIFV